MITLEKDDVSVVDTELNEALNQHLCLQTPIDVITDKYEQVSFLKSELGEEPRKGLVVSVEIPDRNYSRVVHLAHPHLTIQSIRYDLLFQHYTLSYKNMKKFLALDN